MNTLCLIIEEVFILCHGIEAFVGPEKPFRLLFTRADLCLVPSDVVWKHIGVVMEMMAATSPQCFASNHSHRECQD